jgi:hypothetical protein
VLPLPGDPLWAELSNSARVYHNGAQVPTLTTTPSPGSFMGIVAGTQPRQFLAEENLAVICVVIGGQAVACVVGTDPVAAPAPGTFAKTVGGVIVGTVVAPQQAAGANHWLCLVALEPAGRTRRQ